MRRLDKKGVHYFYERNEPPHLPELKQEALYTSALQTEPQQLPPALSTEGMFAKQINSVNRLLVGMLSPLKSDSKQTAFKYLSSHFSKQTFTVCSIINMLIRKRVFSGALQTAR